MHQVLPPKCLRFRMHTKMHSFWWHFHFHPSAITFTGKFSHSALAFFFFFYNRQTTWMNEDLWSHLNVIYVRLLSIVSVLNIRCDSSLFVKTNRTTAKKWIASVTESIASTYKDFMTVITVWQQNGLFVGNYSEWSTNLDNVAAVWIWVASCKKSSQAIQRNCVQKPQNISVSRFSQVCNEGLMEMKT